MALPNAAIDVRDPPSVDVPGGTPVRRVSGSQLQALGRRLSSSFERFRNDRLIVEQRWLRAQRQYLGVYDPEMDTVIVKGRSRAYPRITRTKVISVVARLMNLMFPGDERNWSLDASPDPDLQPQEVQRAVEAYMQANGLQPPPSPDVIAAAVRQRALDAADALSKLIDDQLQELGGDQSQDFITLNRRVLRSGAIYGVGLIRGPFAVETQRKSWSFMPATAVAGAGDGDNGSGQTFAQQMGVDQRMGSPVAPTPTPSPYQQQTTTAYKPLFEFLSVWDFYPDMTARSLREGSGYFVRSVMSRHQFLELAKRPDFMGDVIRDYAQANPTGNYKSQSYENELRVMGVAVNAKASAAREDAERYEVLTWHGPVSARTLVECGAEVPDKRLGDDVKAEVWIVADRVIKADLNPWEKLGVDVPSLHTFLFDEDDVSPLGQGVCDILRDTQMNACNVARMLFDNASVVCGPMLEVNEELLVPGQDVRSIEAYKIFVRDNNNDAQNAQIQAVRNIKVDSHIPELLSVYQMLKGWADTETFVNPQTGGDNQLPSEPMRTMGGASMIRGEAALPFKDIVRQFDTLTASVIGALVMFNRQFNPDAAPGGDYNVVPRGATSLIAKEMRAVYVDQLAQTLTPDDAIYVDRAKLVKARFAARDLVDMMASDDQVKQLQAQQAQKAQQAEQAQQQMMEATLRKTLADAFKNVQQGLKNAAATDAAQANTALDILEKAGMTGGAPAQSPAEGDDGHGGAQAGQGGGPQAADVGAGPGAGDVGGAGMPDAGVRAAPALDAVLGGA